MPIRRLLLLLGFLGLGQCLGCRSASEPPLTPVAGTITLASQPFAGARVHFLPQGDTLGHGGAGMTDAAGKYEIVAHRSNNRKGLLPGVYKVFLKRLLMPDGTPLPAGVPEMDSGARESVPSPYCRRDLTPLSATVGTAGQSFDFDLKK